MAKLLSELLDLPESVHRGDFVLNLAGGVQKPEETSEAYVCTPQLEKAFRESLKFIESAIKERSSKSTYLHGSFGSGKSHFMAMLYLLLDNHPAVTAREDFAAICANTGWRTEKRCLLVPYHMIGSRDMESAILGGYASYVRKHHPEAPIPGGVYRSEGLFRDAQEHRASLGDEKFFSKLSTSSGDAGWGDLDAGWDATRFDAAVAAPPDNSDRGRLVGDLIKHYFPSYESVVSGSHEAFVPLDVGLSIISQHAKSLGYDALILFLDELILWLASHAANVDFIHQEGQKLVKLVESQTSERPIPIVSFVARQRDLRELVGHTITGAEQLGFADSLKHWEGRFHTITLEDRNLPVIAEKRVLKPRSDAARIELDQAFRETEKVRQDVMDVLLTRDGDAEMFRKVYPFSPALVQSLVAVSSALQRERTALKIMVQLLCDKRDTLEVGEVVPVGDLWDQVSQGEEAFVEGMHRQFEMARKIWSRKLQPMLESEHEVRIDGSEREGSDPETLAKLARFEKDARLLKTLLLAAIVPEVESLKNLTPARLAALNHGSIKTPVAGMEGQLVLEKIKGWASRVGELRVSNDAQNPTISIQLVEVDVDSIIDSAKIQDNPANRQRKLRDLLFNSMGISNVDAHRIDHDFMWRGTRRRCEVGFFNVRDAAISSFENDEDEWYLIIDFPFDASGHTPLEDIEKLEEFRRTGRSARTLAWIPEFFSRETQNELGKLVVIDYLLRSDTLEQHSRLPVQDRVTARQLLENQQHALEQKMLLALEAAYGLRPDSGMLIDRSFELERDKFQSLMPDFQPQPAKGANFTAALDNFLHQALDWQFPKHPKFGKDVKPADFKKVLEVCLEANRDTNRRVDVEDKKARPLLTQVAEPLGLGRAKESVFVLGTDWSEKFSKQLAASGQSAASVHDLRRWIDDPDPHGLQESTQDLVILIYAAQANCSLYLHGAPYPGEIGKLDGDMELRQFQGPPEDLWEEARDLAGDIFGVASHRLLDAENLSRFEAAVLDEVQHHAGAARELPGLLKKALTGLSASDDQVENSPRYETALAVAEICEQVAGLNANDLVRAVAEARIQTTAAAMGSGLKSAGEIGNALRGGDWEIFRAISEIKGERASEATRILDTLRDALRADQYAQPLVPVVETSRGEALALLTKSPQEPPLPAEPPPPPAPGETTIETGKNEALSTPRLAALARELEQKLAGGKNRHIDITWRIFEKGSER